jgi:hypothetical protein
MFRRQKHKRSLGRARWLPSLVLLVTIVALLGKSYLQSDAFEQDTRDLFAAIVQPSVIRYVAAALVLFGAGFAFLSNMRVTADRSRRKGGGGLRLGQGPLPDHTRFDPWLERWTGTVLGDLTAIGCWLLQAALALFIRALPPLIIGYTIVTGITLVVLLKQSTDMVAGGTIQLTILVMAAIVLAVFWQTPRTTAALYLLKRRLHNRTHYAYQRLTRGVFTEGRRRPESGHDPDATPRDAESRRRRSLFFRSD